MHNIKAEEWRYSCILEIALHGEVNEQEPVWSTVLVCMVQI
jgi:hypothetical protein